MRSQFDLKRGRRQVHSLPDRKLLIGNMQTVKGNHSRSGRIVAQSFFASFFPSFPFLSLSFFSSFPLFLPLSLPASFPPSFLSSSSSLLLSSHSHSSSLFRLSFTLQTQSGHYFSTFDSIPEKKLASSIQHPFFPGRKA